MGDLCMLLFTWKDIFLIIRKMFDLKQKEIAERLGVVPSTISRLTSGKTGKITGLSSGDIYKLVFAQTESNKKCNESQFLSTLKEAIEEVGLKEIMSDMWNDTYKKGNYQAFVERMLDRTRSSHSTNPDELLNKLQTNQISEEIYVMPEETSITNYNIDKDIMSKPHEIFERLDEDFREKCRLDKDTSKIREILKKAATKHNIADYIDCRDGIFKETSSRDIKDFIKSISRTIIKSSKFSKNVYSLEVRTAINRFSGNLSNYLDLSKSQFVVYSYKADMLEDNRRNIISLLNEILGCNIYA